MMRYSPSYYSPPRRGYGGSPPRRGYGGRGRSPPRRKHGGYGGDCQNGGSLLVCSIPLNCRAKDLRVPFGRFGQVRNVYLPKDYYSGKGLLTLPWIFLYQIWNCHFQVMDWQCWTAENLAA